MLKKIVLVIVLLVLVGCGFKGPLYIPNSNTNETESGSRFTY